MNDNTIAPAIEVTGVKKSFRVFFDKGTSLKEKVLFKKRNHFEEREVLKGVTLTINKGEAVGLIGHNGCGKSTLLKLLTRILFPDEGEIKVNGLVSSLLELGAGFHPDMTGRENIYTNASIFGLSKKQIDERLGSIIEFSELGEYIDNPVRTYSSGMYMRLAFSVAINVDAEVLLIDEILAVGDANFQKKCFKKLKSIKKKGTTIVIVSHSLSQIEEFCDRSFWINDGVVACSGTPKDVHEKYNEHMEHLRWLSLSSEEQEAELAEKRRIEDEKRLEEERRIDEEKRLIEEEKIRIEEEKRLIEEERIRKEQEYLANRKRWGENQVVITKAISKDKNGKERTSFVCGENIFVDVDYKVNEPIVDAVFGFGIFRQDGLSVYGTNTMIEKFPKFNLSKDGRYSFSLETFNMIPGKYTVDVTIEYYFEHPSDYYREAITLEITSKIKDVGVTRIKHDWKFSDDSIINQRLEEEYGE